MHTMLGRLRGLVTTNEVLLYPNLTGATGGVWKTEWPVDWHCPETLREVDEDTQLTPLLKRAWALATGTRQPPDGIKQWLDLNVPIASPQNVALSVRAYGMVQQWSARGNVRVTVQATSSSML